MNLELEVLRDGAVGERLFERLVTVFVLDILADDGDGDFVLGVVAAVDQVASTGEVGLGRFLVQVLEDERVDALLRRSRAALRRWRARCVAPMTALLFDVAEGGDLLLDLAAEVAVGAAEQDVGLDADGEQLLDGVLRGLGLELLRGGDPGNQREVDKDGVFAAQFLAHLADGFEERQRFDVADGAADFDDGDVGAVGGDLAHGVLDFVGDVGNDLDGFAEVVAAALLQDDLLVDAAGGVVVVARERRVGEALVVAQVEVGLGAVVGDKDLAVLEGRHGAGIDVEVGVELHQVDAQAAALKQAADGSRRQTLA